MISIVVADTNILINLCFAESIDLLDRISGVQFLVPPEVETEMKEGRGSRFVSDFYRCVQSGCLEVRTAESIEAIEVYVRCCEEHGLHEGEAAAMALARQEDAYFATTEAAAFKAGCTELGQGLVIDLEDILELAEATGVLTGRAALELRQLMRDRNDYQGRAVQ